MDMFIEVLKAFFIGVVEGITEWLPISSTGHMILVDEFVKLNVSAEFLELFLVVIQLGAIMAVLILYFHKLNPFSPKKTSAEKRGTWRLWGMVAIGCIPAAAIGLTLDDFFNEYFYNAWTAAIALIVYGVVFILLERRNRRREAAYLASRAPRRPRGAHARPVPEVDPGDDGDDAEMALFRVRTVDEIDWKTSLKIGCFQMLAIIPVALGLHHHRRHAVRLLAHGGGGVHVLSRDSRHVRLGRAEAHQVSDGRGSGHDGHRDRRARGGHRDGIRGVGDLHQVPHGLHQEERLHGVRRLPHHRRFGGARLLRREGAAVADAKAARFQRELTVRIGNEGLLGKACRRIRAVFSSC